MTAGLGARERNRLRLVGPPKAAASAGPHRVAPMNRIIYLVGLVVVVLAVLSFFGLR